MKDYKEFLKSKQIIYKASGKEVKKSDIHPSLFGFQRDLTYWAIRKGRCAVFADTGLGKTRIQVVWAKLISEKRALIVAPLSVAKQTVKEGQAIDIEVHCTRSGSDLIDGINITNYEMIDHFNPDDFDTVVLDESSLLKGLSGKIRKKVTEMFADTPYKLCCTATPAPNDIAEIANHAEFLGIMNRTDMLSTFFVHDNNGWRLRGHAIENFYRWMASWGMSVKRPSDLGYDDDGFILPPLNIKPIFVDTDYKTEGKLFFTGLKGIQDRSRVRRETLHEKVSVAAEIINDSDDQWLVWCGLNDESSELVKAIPDAIEVKGSDSIDEKIKAIEGFQSGKHRVMVTKLKIAGLGMNFQNCHKMMFVGLSDSWEGYYQGIRRVYRFMQKFPVDVYIVLADVESGIYDNVRSKEKEANAMSEHLIKNVQQYEQEEILAAGRKDWTYMRKEENGKNWQMILGDSVEVLREFEDCSIDLSVYSPPFQTLYTYTATERDLGNSSSDEEFLEHYNYIISELLRVTKPGRVTAVHVADVPAMLVRDGWIGLKDFSGEVIRIYSEMGWIFDSRIPIDKNQQALKDGTGVFTPGGLVPIESLKPGDFVIGSDGKTTRVEYVHKFESRQMYKVTFSDGTSVECDENHLWSATTEGRRYGDGSFVTMTTKELMSNGLYMPAGRKPRYSIPMIEPVNFCSENLPIHPYLLGVILGDGCISQPSTVGLSVEHEIAECCRELLPPLHKITKQEGTDNATGDVATYYITSDKWHENDVLNSLRDLSLQGLHSWEKSVPEMYLISSIEDRLDLLRGLLDSDGSVRKNGCIVFATTSLQLAYDVQFLVQSFGGIVNIRPTVSKYKYNGETRIGKPQWMFNVQIDPGLKPLKLNRKVARLRKKRQRKIIRSIVSIEPTCVSDCTCISVEAEDGLFVVENFIVTHNSQSIRTHSKALTMTQMEKDRSWIRPALPDYILKFRKPGDNEVPVRGGMDGDTWIEFANPTWPSDLWTEHNNVRIMLDYLSANGRGKEISEELDRAYSAGAFNTWFDIRETDVLQGWMGARADKDSRHICPLQLGTIERCIRLWSNLGELVLDPFMGIGSTGWVALTLGRKAIGIELKPEYYEMAIKNLRKAESIGKQLSLFDRDVEEMFG